MPELKDPRAVFVHKLGETLNMEGTTLKMLEKNEQAATDPELKDLFAHHREETEQQIANLEQAFEKLGEEPSGHVCKGMDGIKAEGRDMMEKIAPELLDGALADGATHVEHYEIATYEGLRTQAEALGASEVADLLAANLEQEQHTLAEIERASQRLTQQAARAAMR